MSKKEKKRFITEFRESLRAGHARTVSLSLWSAGHPVNLKSGAKLF